MNNIFENAYCGYYWANPIIESGLDIISEWHEDINEEKHDVLADNYVADTHKEYMDVY